MPDIPTNEQLMRQVVARDSRALEMLYDRYSGMLYSLIVKIVGDKPAAEDLLQEVFLHIWEKADKYQWQKGSVSTWLMTMARNAAIDRVRSKGHQNQSRTDTFDEELLHPWLIEHKTPLESVVLAEKQEFIKKALGTLSPEQRQSLELAYFGGFSQTEIAEKLEQPLGTVKTRMRQGLIKLRELIMSNYGEMIS